jgi:catechol 2,3-dioxygenase-like lactoylglutathione lyase family enzyme
MHNILDHVGIAVSDMDRSKAFYTKALAPLGSSLLMDYGVAAGFGKGKPDFWLGGARQPGPITPVHVCFAAASRDEVDAFYRAAIEAGGKDNGPPGLRPMYHPNYYGAFVYDPDGHNVEAVFHGG